MIAGSLNYELFQKGFPLSKKKLKALKVKY